MESFLQSFATLDAAWVYAIVTTISFVENVFPPFPSDVVVVAAGSLVALGHVHPLPLVLCASAGSTLGFLTMYGIGGWIGRTLLESGRVRFLPRDRVMLVEAWFQRYGYGVVIANRFLAGTRAVVSFFAGMSHLSLMRCTVLSFISASLWNVILIGAGNKLGANWRELLVDLQLYGTTVTVVLVTAAIAYLVYRGYRRRGGPTSGTTP